MSIELAQALTEHDAAAANVATLRKRATQLAAELVQAQAAYDAARAAQDEGLGLEALGQIKPKRLAEIDAAEADASRKLRGLTSACSLIASQITAAQAATAVAVARVTSVAATDAALLLPAAIERATTLAEQFATALALAFDLQALALASPELASGERAVALGSAAHEALARHGLGAGRGLNGGLFIGPAPGSKARIDPRALLEMSSK